MSFTILKELVYVQTFNNKINISHLKHLQNLWFSHTSNNNPRGSILPGGKCVRAGRFQTTNKHSIIVELNCQNTVVTCSNKCRIVSFG